MFYLLIYLLTTDPMIPLPVLLRRFSFADVTRSVARITSATHVTRLISRARGCQIPICSLFGLFAPHSAHAASALQLLKSGTRSLRLFKYVSALIVFVVISRSTISSTTSMHPNPVSVFLIASQLRHLVTVMRVYKFFLLIYLLIYCAGHSFAITLRLVGTGCVDRFYLPVLL